MKKGEREETYINQSGSGGMYKGGPTLGWVAREVMAMRRRRR